MAAASPVEESDQYVAQLLHVFNSCDTSGTGQLSRNDLYNLCSKLQLEEQSDTLVHQLLGYGPTDDTVNFTEFKDAFVAVLSAVDADSTEATEDETSNRHESFAKRRQGTEADTPLDFPEFSDTDDFSFASPSQTPKPMSKRHMTTPVGTLDHDEERELRHSSRRAEVFEAEGQLNQSLERTGELSLGQDTLTREEQLREIWRTLGVGSNGYLTPSELQTVCEHINMETMEDQELGDLFERLDADEDGLVSFQEFLSGLFGVGGDNEPPLVTVTSPHPRPLSDPRRTSQTPSIIATLSGEGFFSYLESRKDGYASASDIGELWESFGISRQDTSIILGTLDIDANASKISLRELSSALDQELQVANDNPVYLAAVFSCRQELRHTKAQLETSNISIKNLQTSLEASNSRNSNLTLETDERYRSLESTHAAMIADMETKHKEQLKSVTTKSKADRDRIEGEMAHEVESLITSLDKMRKDETTLKLKLTNSESEIKDLENKLQESSRRYSRLEKEFDRQHREMESVTELHNKMAEMESHRDSIKDEQQRFALQKVAQYETEVKELRDQNDELTHDLENLRQQLAASQKEREGKRRTPRRKGSYLSEYNRKQLGDSAGSDSTDESKSLKQRESESYNLKVEELKREHHEALIKINSEHEQLNRKLIEEQEGLRKAAEDRNEQNLRKVVQGHKQEVQESAIRHKGEIIEKDHQHYKEKLDLERQLEQVRREVGALESEWKRKYDSLEAELKLKSARDQSTATEKVQKTHREQMREMRNDLNNQHDRELQRLRDQINREKTFIEQDFQKRIDDFEGTFSKGLDGLKGKMRQDFLTLVDEHAAVEVAKERRLLTEHQELERQRLYDTVQLEKDDMDNLFRDQVYDLERQFDEEKEFYAEEIRAEMEVGPEMEDEFIRQLEKIKDAFEEERDDYEGRIGDLESQMANVGHQTNLSFEINRLKEETKHMERECERLKNEKNKILDENIQLQKELSSIREDSRELRILREENKELSKRSANTSLEENDFDKVVSASKNALQADIIALERKNEELEIKLRQAEEKVGQMESTLELSHFEHQRELIEARMKPSGSNVKDELGELSDVKAELERERLRYRSLQKMLDLNQNESSKLITDAQNESKKELMRADDDKQDLKRRLSVSQTMLSEVTEKLKAQLVKTAKSDLLLKELYVENSHLMQALSVTEQRQKKAEKTSYKKEATVEALQEALRSIAPLVAKV